MFLSVANPREVASLPLPTANPAFEVSPSEVLMSMRGLTPAPAPQFQPLGTVHVTEEVLMGRKRFRFPVSVPQWLCGTLSYRPAPGSGFVLHIRQNGAEWLSRRTIRWEAVDGDNVPGLTSGTIISMARRI